MLFVRRGEQSQALPNSFDAISSLLHQDSIEKIFSLAGSEIREPALVVIERSIEVNSTKDRVWEIISDLEKEPEYWYGTKECRTVSIEGNVVNREITQNFRNHKILQKAVLHPKDSIEIQYLKGLTEGTKVMSVESLSDGKQLVKVRWDVRFTGIYRLMTSYIRSHTEEGTIHALERIKQAAELTQDQSSETQAHTI